MDCKLGFWKSIKALNGYCKNLIEWTNHDVLYKDYLSKLGEFCNVSEKSLNYTQQKLAPDLKLITLSIKIWCAISEKLHPIYDDVAHYLCTIDPDKYLAIVNFSCLCSYLLRRIRRILQVLNWLIIFQTFWIFSP